MRLPPPLRQTQRASRRLLTNGKRSGVEYLCVLNDESSVWMTVPQGNEVLEKYLAGKNTDARGPEIIKDLEAWVKSDFVDE